MSDRLVRLWPLLGVVFVALLVVNIAAGSSKPDSSDSGAQVIAYYTAHSNAQGASAYLVVLAVVIGICWFGGLRGYLRRTPAVEQFAAIGFGGAVIFGVGGLMGVTLKIALSDVPSQLTPAAAQALNILQNDANGLLLSVGIAVLTVGYGIAMIRGGLMPAWLGWLGIAIAVVAVLLWWASPIALVFVGLWVIIVSIALYRRGGAPAEDNQIQRAPRDAMPPSP